MTTKEAVCKRIILSMFFLLVLCRTAAAQDARKGILSAADAGTCTANSTACSFLTIPSGSGGVTFTITANASANTIQFEATGDTEPTGSHTWVALNVVPSNGTTAVTSTTSTGTWQANIAGFTQVRLRCSTFVGGTTTTYINLSTASARSNGGGGSVTHTAGNLTAFHIMIGNGAADATVDSACVTNGTGALSGCTSISAGSGASAAGATATGGFACVEAASTGWTPTAGQDYIRCDSTGHNFLCSTNGLGETPCGGGLVASAMPIATCSGGIAYSNLSLQTTNAPIPACITGTNQLMAVLQFAAQPGTAMVAYGRAIFPAILTSAVVTARTVAITGTVGWGFKVACVANSATIDPAFNTASTSTATVPGTTLQRFSITLSAITTTGCAAGNEMFWAVYRLINDTATTSADMLSVTLQ